MTTHEWARFEQAARRALLRKELREERASIIAGMVIFLVLPIFWTVLYCASDPRFEVIPGVATSLLLIGGWLFGAVVGAQSVCRDFGRAQGAFLLARPVLPGDVIRAKAKAGLLVVGGVSVAAGLWEFLLCTLARNPIDQHPTWGWWLAAASASVVAFWIAFAAAAITRQMLSGVMLAGLALALLITVPMMTTLPARVVSSGLIEPLLRLPQPADNLRTRLFAYTSREVLLVGAISNIVIFVLLRVLRPRLRRGAIRRLVESLGWLVVISGLLLCAASAYESGAIQDFFGWITALLVGGFALLSYGVARRACRSQHALRLGTKAVAWTIGVTMILLGTLAMTQVGANIRVTATCWHPDLGPARYDTHTGLAASAGHFAVGRAPDRLDIYDIAPGGQITHSLPDIGVGRWGAHRRVPFFDARERLFEVSSWPHNLRRSDSDIVTETPIRVELVQVDMTVGVASTPQRLQVPDSIPPDADALVYDAGLANDRLFLLYGYNGPSELHDARVTTFAHAVLAVYNWRDSAAGTLARVYELPNGAALNPDWWGCRLCRGVDRCLYLLTGSLCPINLSTSNLTQLDRHPIVFDRNEMSWEVPCPVGARCLAVSDRTGFFVMELREPAKREGQAAALTAHIIGEVRASPWAWLFRSAGPTLVAAGPGRIWEVHYTSAICYDVSDPTNPRRIAHVTSYAMENAVAGPDYLLLDHGAGFSLVRNPP